MKHSQKLLLLSGVLENGVLDYAYKSFPGTRTTRLSEKLPELHGEHVIRPTSLLLTEE